MFCVSSGSTSRVDHVDLLRGLFGVDQVVPDLEVLGKCVHRHVGAVLFPLLGHHPGGRQVNRRVEVAQDNLDLPSGRLVLFAALRTSLPRRNVCASPLVLKRG